MGAPTKVNGFLDPDLIADSFVRHFKAVCRPTDERNEVFSNLRTICTIIDGTITLERRLIIRIWLMPNWLNK